MDSIASTISMGLPGQLLAAQSATTNAPENEAAANTARTFAKAVAQNAAQMAGPTGVPSIPSLGDNPSLEQIEQVGTEFESVFLSMLLKEMRNSLDNGFFGSEGSDSFGGMFDMFIGQHLAKTGAIGVGDLLVQQYNKPAAKESEVKDADQSTRVSFSA